MVRMITCSEIEPLVDQEMIIESVKKAFIGHYHGLYYSPMPGQLVFADHLGDCHIKYGYAEGGPIFVVKMATGFYGNYQLNLPVNNGLLVVFSAKTGEPLAIVQDGGLLTSLRTAAAGVLAAALVSFKKPKILGILGSGHQAELQARWMTKQIDIEQVLIWSRNAAHAAQLSHKLTASGIQAVACTTINKILSQADLLVMATPSDKALFSAHELEKGMHIVAIGANTPGKQELDPHLFARASVIITDDHRQCAEHGDFSYAVKAGVVDKHADVSFGMVLESQNHDWFKHESLSIVDLTGIPAQDIEIATLFCMLLGILD